MSNHLAKCISTNCPKYADCLRAVSQSTAEMLYEIYCKPDTDYSNKEYEWFVESYENESEQDNL